MPGPWGGWASAGGTGPMRLSVGSITAHDHHRRAGRRSTCGQRKDIDGLYRTVINSSAGIRHLLGPCWGLCYHYFGRAACAGPRRSSAISHHVARHCGMYSPPRASEMPASEDPWDS